MNMRVRFAPSPTGKIHIGNIRTAIFNWLFARHNNGAFLLRIEDTDLERSTIEAKEALFDCMQWLGLDYDEEVFYQSSRADSHLEAAKKLLDSGDAYYLPANEGKNAPLAFRIPWGADDLPFVRTVGETEVQVHPDVPFTVGRSGVKYAQISKKGKPVETAACLAGYKDLKIFDESGTCVFELSKEIGETLSGEKSFSFEKCSKISFTRREVFYKDLIKGELSKPLDSMKDLIILRGDGSPVFHLANVCDDAEQKITHIVRGDDHVENTYRHVLLFAALGHKAPEYAHLPMIVNQSGKPYSKRDGDAFVGDFREKGFLGDALFNYLSLLGWSPGDDREKMSKQELIEAFTLERVRSAPSQFDINKFKNLNGQYIAEMNAEAFMEAALNAAKKIEWAAGADSCLFEKVCALMQPRAKVLADVETWKYFFSDEMEYDEKVLCKTLKKDEIKEGLKAFSSQLENFDSISKELLEKTLRHAEEVCGLSEGQLNKPARLAVTAASGGADILDTLSLIGKEKITERISKALSLLS